MPYRGVYPIPLKNAQYYVLDFWFLACLPCVEQYLEIKKKLAQLQAKSVELIGVSTDSNPEKWKDYLVKHSYIWANYLQDPTASITKDLSILSFPAYVILNKAGEIVDTYNFSDVLKKFGVN